MMDETTMRDVQAEFDDRQMPIDQVGVKDIRYPVIVREKSGGEQHTIATVNMYVDLPHHFRGTHMSRFLEILNLYRTGICTRNIRNILASMKSSLDAERAFFEIEFPFFMLKKAPVSGAESSMEYICRLHGDSAADHYQLSVRVPVLSLCPCSKEISAYGAHNQRSYITITVCASEIIWIEDIVGIAESSASIDIYSLLKREDEKYVTEKAYEKPMFVEDMVRSAAQILRQRNDIISFTVESENMESIHNHSAYARIYSRSVTTTHP